mmetsp:Transcript_48900/g.119757  ORF Transcript_48900/g.119757 Transcript_48900/m.119757 type:complete len:102 (+) Transcript_48900:444-749(+)
MLQRYPRKTGYMKKAGKLNPAMKERFFVLLERHMYYFDNDSPTTAANGAIDLKRSTITCAGADDKQPALLTLVDADGRTWKLVAASRDEALEWATTLSGVQ